MGNRPYSPPPQVHSFAHCLLVYYLDYTRQPSFLLLSIMVFDSKSSTSVTSSPPPQLHPELDDFPPSYDSATAHPGASVSTAAELPRQPPKDTLYLFEGPAHSEPLLGRADTPLGVLNSIETYRKGAWVYSSDHRLQNRTSSSSATTSLTPATTLYDFIRHSSLSHPALKVQCTGIHFETPERDEVVQDRDGPRQRKKGQVERIVDFDFSVGTVSSSPFSSVFSWSGI